MTFKSIAEFLAPKNKHNPTSAERKLIAATQAGEPCKLFDPERKPARPTGPDEKVTIRANLLRLLILGGTKECGLHERGVWLEGGWIEGRLDLSFCIGKGQIGLKMCQFNDMLGLDGSTLEHLNLESSALPGLSALGMTVKGEVLLTRVESSATVTLNFASILNRLNLSGATLNCLRSNQGGNDEASVAVALRAEGLKLGSDLMLRNTTCHGLVDLTHATIKGQLDCSEASFDYGGHPEDIVPFHLASDNDDFASQALSARRLCVERGFIFSRVRAFNGHLMLHGAHIGDLLDDIDSWPKGQSRHLLAGFTYNRFGVSAPASIANRLEWLKRGVESYPAYAQPYTHLAKVLRQAGHSAEAREVLIERTYAQGKARRASMRVAPNGDVSRGFHSLYSDFRRFAHFLFDRLALGIAGYGYAPARALLSALTCIGVSFFAYAFFWQSGVMVPTDAVILTSWEWLMAYISSSDTPALIWAESSGPATSHYETFYSLPYALDVFLPIVDLGQQSTWGQTTVTTMGKVARVYTWGLQIAGYVITSLGLAAATGIIQRNQPD